ncbi:DUF3159 domain-containing protein [Nocardia sp. NPDC050712]|uniref:DUF3159 domain-containing protein n=1 Tax=Nocardia sp. NPDC050712 TaxID=3155518 RepID=UPI0033FB2A2C
MTTPDPQPRAEEPAAVSAQQRLLDQLGGPKGMVYTAIPIVGFVVANALVALPIAIAIALAVAVALTGWRLLRGEPFTAAIGGLTGVAVAAGVAAWTGSAGGFFLIGIWASLAGALALLFSLVIRRPLTGVLWNLLHGGRHAWRRNRPALIGHDIATLTLTLLFAARFVVQRWLYDNEATGWLAFAKIAMGTPLLALALVVVVWAFRRSSEHLAPGR